VLRNDRKAILGLDGPDAKDRWLLVSSFFCARRETIRRSNSSISSPRQSRAFLYAPSIPPSSGHPRPQGTESLLSTCCATLLPSPAALRSIRFPSAPHTCAHTRRCASRIYTTCYCATPHHRRHPTPDPDPDPARTPPPPAPSRSNRRRRVTVARDVGGGDGDGNGDRDGACLPPPCHSLSLSLALSRSRLSARLYVHLPAAFFLHEFREQSGRRRRCE
jgi:hypothetical protein